jgi:S1-C subfamily serine protease
MLSLALLALVQTASLEELFVKVDPSVVTVRVATKSLTQDDNGAMMAVAIITGSGVLVHGEGYVVTAAHVVENAELIEVHSTKRRIATLLN